MSFKARYNSRCANCPEEIDPGMDVTLVQSNRGTVTVHVECAGAEMVTESSDDRDHTPTTMPRGKTARDVCTRCFMVPASNGVCGCEG